MPNDKLRYTDEVVLAYAIQKKHIGIVIDNSGSIQPDELEHYKDLANHIKNILPGSEILTIQGNEVITHDDASTVQLQGQGTTMFPAFAHMHGKNILLGSTGLIFLSDGYFQGEDDIPYIVIGTDAQYPGEDNHPLFLSS